MKPTKNTNNKRNTTKINDRLQAIENNLPGRSGASDKKTPTSSLKFSTPTSKGEAELVGKVLRMMIDPCNSPAVSIPDAYNGKTILVKSVTRSSFSLDGSGNRGVMIAPTSKSKIAVSGASTYSTWTFFDDQLQAELAGGDYAYGRQVAMCATIKPLLPTTSAAPSIRSWCGPHLSTSDRTSSGTNFNDKPLANHQTRVDVEAAWCAREMKNFVPILPTVAPGASSANIEGGLLSYVPALHFELTGGTASAPLELEVVTVYEMFYSESSQYKPGLIPVTNMTVMSRVISGIRSFKWMRDGSAIGAVTQYANKAMKFAQRPDVQAAWSIGKDVALAAIL
jgi:hypothetical protein